MNIEYKIFIGNLHTMSDGDSIKDLVVNVEYTYMGSAFIKDRTYAYGLTKSVYIVNDIEDVNKDGLIDYRDLTENVVKEWVMKALSEKEINEMQRIISSKIEADSMLTIRTAPWVEITQGVPSQEPLEEIKK